MPKKVERRLAKEAKRKGLTGDRAKAYVYGTMNKAGLLHNSRKQHRHQSR